MDSHIFNCFKEGGRGKEACVFFSILILLLFVLTASVGVDVYNKLKESRYIGQDVQSRNTITASAKGEVYAKPDMAVTNVSVVNEAKTVSEAMAENTKKMNAVIDFMKGQGIEDKDLKTASFNIYPRYEWQDSTVFYPYGRRVLAGYEVRQSLQVKIRDMEKIGSIIEGATKAGANEVGDLQFTIDNEDELKNQARIQAIGKAKVKAKELAEQLGVRLGRMTNFSENVVSPYYGYGLEMQSVPAGVGGGGAAQIETGENKIEATVSITYELN